MFVLFAYGVTFHTSNFYSYGDIEGRVNTIELRHVILQVGILEIKKKRPCNVHYFESAKGVKECTRSAALLILAVYNYNYVLKNDTT